MTVAEPPALAQPRSSDGSPAVQPRFGYLTVESLAYLVLIGLGLIAHGWALGDRALHHDETIHAWLSWKLLTGQGYIHDPLTHGPLLYHLTALAFFLFGDNDTTARLMPALFGSALIGLPWFLRPHIGRGAALIAAGYLLISPAFLYVGRFIRHDIASVFFELLVFISILRYGASHRPAWLYTGSAAFALMYVNHGTSFLYLAVIGSMLALTFFWRVWRPGVAISAALGVALVLLIFILPAEARRDANNYAVRDLATSQMVIERPSPLGWQPLETDDNAYALLIRHRWDDNLLAYLGDLGRFVAHPAVISALVLTAGALALLVWAVWRRPDARGQTIWQRRRADDPLVAAWATLADRRRVLIAAAIFLTIYLVFYTTFFTNLVGSVSGTTGVFLYWLAQHGVQRGSQPWYYYLVLLVIYEPLLVVWSTAGLGIVAAGLLAARRRQARTLPSTTPEQALHWAPGDQPPASTPGLLLLCWWLLGSVAIYSWAGEKMPWLTIHVALPMVILGAWACDRVLRGGLGPWIPWWLDRRPEPESPAFLVAGERGPLAIFTGFVFAISVMFYTLLTVSTRPNAPDDRVTLAPFWLFMALGLILLLTVACALRWGRRWALAAVALSLTLLGGVHTIRAAWQLNYLNGDTPREMIIYVQTSPDARQVVQALEQASVRRNGNLSMPILYDNETIWDWYLRNYQGATEFDRVLAEPPTPEVQAILISDENIANPQFNPETLQGFVVQKYPLRWWFPEDQAYRLPRGWRELPEENRSLLGRLLSNPFDGRTFADLWNYLLFREPPAGLGSSDFYVAVRPELAAELGLGTGSDSGIIK